MPIFEYQCLACTRAFEHFQRGAGSDPRCPSCGSEQLERQISLCGVSSDQRQAANLTAAHQKAATKRSEKQRSEHQQHHEHFGDTDSSH